MSLPFLNRLALLALLGTTLAAEAAPPAPWTLPPGAANAEIPGAGRLDRERAEALTAHAQIVSS